MNMDGRRAAVVGAGALGWVSVTVQLVLFRELTAALAVNELVLGVLLGNWLLAGGLGAWLGRGAGRLRHPGLWLAAGLGASALLPVLMLLGLRFLRNRFLPPGVAGGFGDAFAVSLFVLTPGCLLAGFLVPVATALARKTAGGDDTSSARLAYAADAAGGVAGGALATFLFLGRLDPFQNLAVAAAVGFGAAVWLFWREARWGAAVVTLVLSAALIGVCAGGDLDLRSLAWLHPGSTVTARLPSAYESLVMTRAGEQFTLHGNGLPLASTGQTERAEEPAHFALAQRPDAWQVLLIGGSLTGVDREILKHPVLGLDCVEADPAILAAADRFVPPAQSDLRRLRIPADGRLWLNRGADGRRYDVIILDLPPPDTLQINRFYTVEALAAAKAVLTPDGVVALPLGQYQNYVGLDLAAVLACGTATARSVFRHVLLLPGDRVFLLASDGPLTADIAGRLAASRIPVRLLTRSWLAATLDPDRLSDLERAAALPAPVNRDSQPVLFRLQARHWLERVGGAGGLVAAAGAGLFCLGFLFRQRAPGRMIFAAGFAASTLEIVLLLGLQAAFGALNRQVGLIFTVFLAGLAAGACGAAGALGKECSASNRLARIGFVLALAAAGLPWLVRAAAMAGPWTGQTLLAAAAFVLAWLTGAAYPAAVRLASTTGTTAAPARLYAADLFGASLGALLAGSLLIPFLGLTGASLLCAGLCLVMALPLCRE